MRKLTLLLFTFSFLLILANPANGQAPPFGCSASVSVPLVARSEGLAELAGDLLLTCSGGTPTPAGQIVPTVNLTLTLNANLTSKLTSVGQWQFSEALMIVDEPGSALNPTRPILNCGNNGAPDVSLAGPGICSIIGTGNPALSYDGTPNGYGTALCDGLAGRPAPNSSGVCGRPNVFQGRLPNPSYLNQALFPGQVLFEDVPLDPPGTTTTRTMRFTNLRIDPASVNPAAPGTVSTVQVTVSTDNSVTMPIENPQQVVAYIEPGLKPNPGSCSGAGTEVCIQEGFAASWRPKNISFAVGNLISGNASFSPSNPEFYWAYNGTQNYPPDVAQNVPGAIYNTESGFEWVNNSPNGPPSPNPPQGIGAVTVEQGLAGPLYSPGLLFPATEIGSAGIADSGTRIRVLFTGLPAGASIQIPTVVTLSNSMTTSSGVMVLTNTDSAGSGQFRPYNTATVTLVNNSGSAFAYYEVLWADPFSIETAAVPYTLLNAPPGTSIQTSSAFAPFYSDSASAQANSTSPAPRFLDSSLLCAEQSCLRVTPSQGVNTAPIQLSFTSYGSQSLTGAQVALRAPGLPDIPGTSTTSSTPSALVGTFDLTAATPGLREIVITPVGMSSIVLPTEFNVTGVAPVVVPNIVGQSQSFATSVITSYQLVVGTVTQQSSRTVSAGSVISESPVAGTSVNVGSVVNLVISTGPPQVAVPNVVGSTQLAAITAISSAGLVVGTITQQSSGIVPAGYVITESPTAGTLANPGSVVNLVVSSGPQMVAVPNVVGQTQATATAMIAGAELVPGIVSSGTIVYSGPQNLVLQSVPGTTQNLVINLAGDPGSWDTLALSISASSTASVGSNMIVPDSGVALAATAANFPAIAEYSLGDPYPSSPTFGSGGEIIWQQGRTGGFSDGTGYAAMQFGTQGGGPAYSGWIHFRLQNSALPTATLTVIDWAYFNVTGQTPSMGQVTIPVGIVLSESPVAGATVNVGSSVNLLVSAAAQVLVPNVVGSTQPAATAAMTGVGLVVGTLAQQSSSTAPSGSVISESPVAGTAVTIGSPVNLVISTGPAQVAVPNVLNQTQSAATTSITGAGLVVGSVTQQSSNSVPSGSVISESPVAGTSVNVGSAVNLVVSTGPAKVAVPNVVGATQAAATTAITSAGLVVGTVTSQLSSTVAVGSVISESPAAGTLVTIGSAVNLVVSSGSGQTGPPPAFVQVNHNEISAGPNVPVKFGAATHAGNTIVVYAIWDNAGTASVTDTRGDNFVSVSPPVTWGSGYSAQIFYATNVVGGTDTVTTAFKSPANSFGVAYAHEYSGINTSNPVDVIASASGSSKSLNSGTATTTAANDLIFGAGVSDNLVSTSGSGFVARDLSYGNITEDRTGASVGSYSATATHNGQKWAMQMVAFRAAAGGGTVAAPTFTPPAGSYTSAQSVKLGTTTPGASIYYTTDGSTPSTSSTLYTVPINVTSSLTIKAIGHLSGMSDSPVVSAGYQITGTGTPPPSFVQVNDNQISAGSIVPVTLHLAAKPGNTIVVYAIWDNAGPASVTDSQGNHFVSVSAPVSWGNGYSAQIFYAAGIVGGAETINTAFQTPTQSFGVVYAHEYSGIDISNPVDATASANGSSSTLNSSAATTTSANDLIFAAGVSDSTVTAAGPGFNARDLAYGNITEDQTGASIGSYLATATHNGNQWGMQLVAFRPAP